MSFHLFSKKVYDADLCFVRDLVEIGSAIASVTSIPVMRQVINGIIKKYRLESKLQEFSDNGHYIIEDCYHSNRDERMKRAADILKITKELPITPTEAGTILYAATNCVKKMGFSYPEKIKLITENLISVSGNKELDDFMVQQYIDTI